MKRSARSSMSAKIYTVCVNGKPHTKRLSYYEAMDLAEELSEKGAYDVIVTDNKLQRWRMKAATNRRMATQWPPRNEKPADRQGKISHLLRIILDHCDSINDWETDFINKMGDKLNKRRGIEPATALTEKQARKLRSIIFRHYRNYKQAVPSLPSGVKFEDEVRRLLKSQANPNESRNQLITLGEGVLSRYLSDLAESNEWWDGEMNYSDEKRYKGINGNILTFDVTWTSAEGGSWVKTYKVNVDTRKVDAGKEWWER